MAGEESRQPKEPYVYGKLETVSVTHCGICFLYRKLGLRRHDFSWDCRHSRHGFWRCRSDHDQQTNGQGGAGTDEQGCSGWNGSDIIIGASACAPAYTGADSKVPAKFPHNDAPLLSSLGITSAGQIAIIFNPDQSGPDHPITLDDLTITLWNNATGALIWNSGDITGGNTNGGDADFFAHTDSGVGKSGIVYVLDATQAAALDAMGLNFSQTRIGLSAFVTGATGGPDSFSVAKHVVPEPSFFFFSLAGLMLTATIGHLGRRRA